MRKIIVALALAGLTSAGAMAADGALAVIDAQKIYMENAAAEGIRNELRQLTEDAQVKINKMEETLRQQQEDLKARRSALSEEKYAEEKLKLTQSYREFRQKAQEIQAGLDRRNMELKRDITEEVRAVVEQLAKERGYKAVMQKNLILFADDSIDISDEVLKRVDARLKAKKK